MAGCPEGVWFSLDSDPRSVLFDSAGVRYRVDGRDADARQWSEVWSLDVERPTSSLWGFHLLRVLDIIGPRPVSYSSREVEVHVENRLGSVSWPLGRAGRYPWRLALVVDQTTRLLGQEKKLHLLGQPGFLDQVVSQIAPAIPARARLMVRTDLPGLNRRRGGHGAYDQHLRELVNRTG